MIEKLPDISFNVIFENQEGYKEITLNEVI